MNDIRLTRRGRIVAHIAAWLGALLLALTAIDFDAPAKAEPEPPSRVAAATVVDGWSTRVQQIRLPRVICQDPVVRTLRSAGFRGNSLRIAYAIVMRESKGQNLDESSPYYTGALGIWQIQTSAHSGKPWWSRAAMLDPYRQSRIVYLHMSNRGRWWQPWGLTPQGTLDATNYQAWGPALWEAWIMAPFRKYYAAYPC